MTLAKQIDALIREGALQIFKARSEDDRDPKKGRSGEGFSGGGSNGHEQPTMGELHTIVGGFFGDGLSSANRKKYARVVMLLEERSKEEPCITFSNEDLVDVFPHDNDPVVISLVMKSMRVYRVLLYQGSSTDVLFWDAFVLSIPI